MAAEARDHFARIVPYAAREKLSVEVSRRFRIELVDALGQESA
jgi:hypothetical protein